jgi:hypothetical protein
MKLFIYMVSARRISVNFILPQPSKTHSFLGRSQLSSIIAVANLGLWWLLICVLLTDDDVNIEA